MRKSILLISSWVLCAVFGFAQQPLEHEVTVTLKLVQIFVTDKDGNPVKDLEISDFELYEDGKLKTITDFEKHILTPDMSATDQTKSGAALDGLPQISRKFLLFFDLAFNDQRGITKAQKAALHFIDTQLHPQDEIGVITYDALRGITLSEYFTREHQKVRENVENLKDESASGRAEDIINNYWRKRLEVRSKMVRSSSKRKGQKDIELIEGEMTRQMAQAAGFDRRVYSGQARNYTQYFQDLSQALRYVPGTKHIVMFSAGVANFAGIRDAQKKVGAELAASNSPIYSINTGRRQLSFENSGGNRFLQQLAKLSGGDYYHNVNNYEIIAEKIHKITSSFYVLGYYINEKWDGKYHKIKVKVKRKGCKVFGQMGYFNPKAFSEYTELEKQFHLIDLALSEKPLLQEPIKFPLVALPFSGRSKSNFVAIARLSSEKIQELAGSKMEIVSLIFDKENEIIDMQACQVSSVKDIKDAFYYTFSELPSGDYDCRIVMRNLETGQGATASALVSIPKELEKALMLNDPLLLVPKQNAQYICGTKNPEIKLTDIFPFDSSLYAPVIKNVEKDASSILVLMRYPNIQVESAEIEFQVQLVKHAQGEESSESIVDISEVSWKDYKEHMLCTIKVSGLLEGRYSLRIIAEDRINNLKSETETEFFVH